MRKVSGRWTVELNADSIPRLKINQQYAAMGNSARNDADGQFIRSNLQEARWLIKVWKAATIPCCASAAAS